MYIKDHYYNTNLMLYHNLRDYMLFNVYNRIDCINEIMDLISSKIDVIDISYSSTRMEITVNIKKTTLRKAKGYEASTIYYYGIMNEVFKNFFERHPEIVNNISRFCEINLQNLNDIQFTNICQLFCIGDKTVSIRL